MNWDILGHEWAVQLLKEHVAQNRVRHAYLITGPRGTGRRTLGIRLAKALNCLNPPAAGEFCGSCSACLHLERMEHPDLSIVQAEPGSGTLKVDQVRELQRSLSLAPYQARYRVALLLHFEDANPNAANALLKTLEEPSPQVILILTAESAESLLPTIVSRCEVLRLGPLPVAVVCDALQTRWGIPAEEARLLAHLSEGRPGYALALHQEPERLEFRRSTLGDLERLLKSSRVERFAYADTLAKDREKIRQALPIWLSFWRDIFLRTAGVETPITNLDQEDQIDNLAAQVDFSSARRAVTAIQRTLDLFDRNVNHRLAVEVLLLDLPRLSG